MARCDEKLAAPDAESAARWRNPACNHRSASSATTTAICIAVRESPWKTLRLRSFQRHQAMRMTRESNPLRSTGVSEERVWSHRSRKSRSGGGARAARPQCTKALNHTSLPWRTRTLQDAP